MNEAQVMRTVVIDELSPAEKLDLIGELWDSLEAEAIPLTPAQAEDLDRRMAAADVEPGIPWEEVVARLERRLR
jgi:putative addiction module component (TIGR02574 family)